MRTVLGDKNKFNCLKFYEYDSPGYDNVIDSDVKCLGLIVLQIDGSDSTTVAVGDGALLKPLIEHNNITINDESNANVYDVTLYRPDYFTYLRFKLKSENVSYNWRLHITQI